MFYRSHTVDALLISHVQGWTVDSQSRDSVAEVGDVSC